MAVALRVSRSPAEQPAVRLRRARRPGRHPGDPRTSPPPTSCTAGGCRRSADRSRRRRTRSPRRGSRPTRSAATRATRRSSPASAYPAMRSWVRVVTVPEYQDYVETLARRSTQPGSSRQSRKTTPRAIDEAGADRRGPMTAPTVSTPRPEVVTPGVPEQRAAWIERATSADHKVVGLLYIATALSFLAVAAVEFALLRLQLLRPREHPDRARDLQPAAERRAGHLRRPRPDPAGARADRLRRARCRSAPAASPCRACTSSPTGSTWSAR